eukprot:m.91344 g.91344  ORF g.91344 m.91344 type:complete len:461 (-) comp18215_c0_seq1:30-1412(-)
MGFNSVIEAQLDGQPVQLTISGGSGNRVSISITAEEGRVVAQSDSGWSFSTLSDNQLQITMGERCLGLSFVQHQDALFAEQQLRLAASSVFDRTREQASVAEYFKFYAILSQQQNMLTDFVRTGTYQRAMMMNSVDFRGKVVCDVGCGTGILSFFAAQAGARKVYGIEASNMADYAKKLVAHNGMSHLIQIINGKVEEVELPEKVDIIISEPMGIMLVNERMLESYVHARKWLKPGGNMFPTTSTFFVCPFNDEHLYYETASKAGFWTTPSFFGVDVGCLWQSSNEENFRQPVVEYIEPHHLLGEPVCTEFDFLSLTEDDLQEIRIPFEYTFTNPTLVHGIATWFDVVFRGSQHSVTLSTSPRAPLTHWYQVRCLLKKPVLLPPNETMCGELHMKANRKQSYDIVLRISIKGSSVMFQNEINLKEPNFRLSSFPGPSPAMMASVEHDTARPPVPPPQSTA